VKEYLQGAAAGGHHEYRREFHSPSHSVLGGLSLNLLVGKQRRRSTTM
jgi:hypothetical protein